MKQLKLGLKNCSASPPFSLSSCWPYINRLTFLEQHSIIQTVAYITVWKPNKKVRFSFDEIIFSNILSIIFYRSEYKNLALFFDGLFPICPLLSEIVSHWNVSDGLMMSRGSYKMDESSLSLEHIVIGTNCWPIFQSDRSSDWKERAVPFNPFWKTSQTQILLII